MSSRHVDGNSKVMVVLKNVELRSSNYISVSSQVCIEAQSSIFNEVFLIYV